MKMLLTATTGFLIGRYKVAAICVVASALLLILLFSPHLRDLIWSVVFVDIVVIFVAGGAVLLLLQHQSSKDRVEGWSSRFTPEGLTAIAAAVAIFAGYASFRNQSRLAAEIGLSAEGSAIFEVEMKEPYIRCLYDNLAHNEPTKCLREIASDPVKWSTTIFYVEETFWTLEKAEDHKKEWGSAYSQDITYWRKYINEDVTGIFSYYLISINEDYELARQQMERSSVNIKGICRKYHIVRRALVQAKAQPGPVVVCPSE